MALKIRLKKFGTKKRPFYRVVVMDSRDPRDGKVLEEVGMYHPIEDKEHEFKFEQERISEWLKKGATTSETVRRLLNKHNFFIKHK